MWVYSTSQSSLSLINGDLLSNRKKMTHTNTHTHPHPHTHVHTQSETDIFPNSGFGWVISVIITNTISEYKGNFKQGSWQKVSVIPIFFSYNFADKKMSVVKKNKAPFEIFITVW